MAPSSCFVVESITFFKENFESIKTFLFFIRTVSFVTSDQNNPFFLLQEARQALAAVANPNHPMYPHFQLLVANSLLNEIQFKKLISNKKH